jgi:hypothetical protein
MYNLLASTLQFYDVKERRLSAIHVDLLASKQMSFSPSANSCHPVAYTTRWHSRAGSRRPPRHPQIGMYVTNSTERLSGQLDATLANP